MKTEAAAADEKDRRLRPPTSSSSEPVSPPSPSKMISRRRRRPTEDFHAAARIILLLHCVLAPPSCLGLKQSHYVHWNSSNPIFRIDNTDHIIDVNGGNQPWEYDQVNIICPLYQRGTLPDEMETYIIYSVNKEEYDSCRIMSPNPRVIAQCTKPHQLMYFTITFRSFTPTPNGMEFHPGKDYYFISTSAHGDLHRRLGGKCSTHNMKVQFKVANNNHETGKSSGSSLTDDAPPDKSLSAPPRAVNIPRPPPSASTSTTEKSPPSRPRNVYGYREKLPRYTYGDLSSLESEDDYYDYQYRPHKKSGGSFRHSGGARPHPNDVIKHEASRMAAASAAAPLARTASSSAVALVLWCLAARFSVTCAALS